MNKNNNPYPSQNMNVKPGDEIEFMSIENKQKELMPMLLKGIVTKVMTNSVIVDMSNDKNHVLYYQTEHTVVNHRKYKIISAA